MSVSHALIRLPLRRPLARRALTAIAAAAAVALGGPGAASAAEVAAASGLALETPSWSAEVFDFDRDGRQDLLINGHYRQTLLYRNEGGRFAPVPGVFPGGKSGTEAASAGVAGGAHGVGTAEDSVDRHGCDAADIDQNGLLDIVCVQGGLKGVGEKVGSHLDEVLIQGPVGTFTNMVEEYGLASPWNRGRDVAFLDFNGDRYPDLYVANKARQDGHPSEDTLYENVGGTGFKPVAGNGGLYYDGDNRCAIAVDHDRDGRDDLVLCGRTARLFMNQRDGTFRASTDGFTCSCGHVAFGDLDGRGRLDVVQAAGSAVLVKTWTRYGWALRRSIAQPAAVNVAIGDHDGDGRNDFYVVNAGDPRVPTNNADVIFRRLRSGRLERLRRVAEDGTGNVVAAIDRDGDGDDEFVVLNGMKTAIGPVQLFEY